MATRAEVCPRYSKYSVLLHNIGGRILRDAIDHFCLQSVPDFKTFLNNKKHDLFHLWRRRCCSVHPVTSHGQPIVAFQWNILFQKTGNSCIVSSRVDCPCKYEARNVTTAVLDVTLAIIIIKNVCPGPLQTSTDIEVVREKKNTLVSHIVGAYMTEEQFKDAWTNVKVAVCNIASCISEAKANRIEKDIEQLGNDNSTRSASLENTRVQMVEHIKDTTFQMSEGAITFGIEQLKKKGIIIYTGYGGSGKTKLAWETMRKMKEENTKDESYNIIALDMLEHWNTVVDSTEKSIVLLDDCFGRVTATRNVVEEKSKFFNTLYACIGTGKIKVIMTLRCNILAEVKSKLLESRLFKGIYQDVVIDLSIKQFAFTEEEKQLMLRKHLEAKKIEITQVKKAFYADNEQSIDHFTISDIARTNHHCYPLMTYLFCSKPKFLRLGVKHFQQPRESLMDDIKEMRDSEKESMLWSYCALVYMALRDGMLDMNEMDRDLFHLILKNFHTQAGDMPRLRIEISKAMKHLKFTYVVELKQNQFLVIHTSILEAVVISVGEFYPEMIIANGSDLVRCEMLVPHNFVCREYEQTLKINPDMYELSAARFLKEIREKFQSQSSITTDILQHRLFTDQEFSQHFITYARNQLSTGKEEHMLVVCELFLTACRINRPDIVCMTLDMNMKRSLIEHGLKDCCYFNNPEVVDILLKFLDPSGTDDTLNQARRNIGLEDAKLRIMWPKTKSSKHALGRNFYCRLYESDWPSIQDAFLQACSFGSYESVIKIFAHYRIIPEDFEISFNVIHKLRIILHECFQFNTSSAFVMSFLSKKIRYLRNKLNCERTWECECVLTNLVDLYTKELLSTVHLPVREASKLVWNSIANGVLFSIIINILKNRQYENVRKLPFNDIFFRKLFTKALEYFQNSDNDALHSCKMDSTKRSRNISSQLQSFEECSCLGCSVQGFFQDTIETKSTTICTLNPEELERLLTAIDERHFLRVITGVGLFLKLTSKLCSAVRIYTLEERKCLTTTLKWVIRGCEIPAGKGPKILNEILAKNPDTNVFQNRDDIVSVKFSILEDGLSRCFKAGHEKIALLLVDTCLCFHTCQFLTPKNPNTFQWCIPSKYEHSVFGYILLETIEGGRYDLAYTTVEKYKNLLTTHEKVEMIVVFCYENQKSKAEQMFGLFDEFPTKEVANAICKHMNCKPLIDIIFSMKPTTFSEKIVLKDIGPQEMTIKELAELRIKYNGKYVLQKLQCS